MKLAITILTKSFLSLLGLIFVLFAMVIAFNLVAGLSGRPADYSLNGNVFLLLAALTPVLRGIWGSSKPMRLRLVAGFMSSGIMSCVAIFVFMLLPLIARDILPPEDNMRFHVSVLPAITIFVSIALIALANQLYNVLFTSYTRHQTQND